MSLHEFLTARLDEDETVARQAAPTNDDGSLYHPVWIYDREHFRVVVEDGTQVRFDGTTDVDGTHAARHDPARVLHEVAAKRVILEVCREMDVIHSDSPREDSQAERILRALAAPYADHLDFDPAWRVE